MCRTIILPLILAAYVSLTAEDPISQDNPTSSPPAATTAPAQSQPTERQSFPRNPTQARILEELLHEQERDRVQPILSEGGADTGTPGEQRADQGSLLTDGARLYEKLGRLVVSNGRSEFHFSTGALSKEIRPIMVFNKNQLLEMMEGEAQRGIVEFIITADVTRYRGENYLTLLKYRRQVSHGNLTP